ncbi:Ovarian cancer-associated protein 2 [Coemansia sp. RSA 2706]|nr:Ovarian cancer-associated protein 2 [Coemansia sp. RSA 2706]KAJ2316237.1 Ovarian cancer-associated protein 2 [Coemansia sp. RSA 2704]KAJ2319524.1 Ovarian cancer-associated protein 2 [Coemansia sp. RSA 2702]KAJ2728371.1 Ovarian cancer-associated protein 2 [Coemansia sp. Cherry 401B]
MTQQPLRVLCLHGYTQNAQKFRDRTGPFRRSLKRALELVYVTAPHQATDFQPLEPAADDGPSAAWWNRSGRPWAEIKQSVRFLRQTMHEQGPFDGILGFSQGSGMAAILMALIQAAHTQSTAFFGNDAELAALVDELAACPPPKFAMLFAGFYPDLPQFDALIKGPAGPIAVPSLHMVGEKDAIVPMERGKLLASQAFVDATLLTHEGGHFVPCNATWRKRYQEFISALPAQ